MMIVRIVLGLVLALIVVACKERQPMPGISKATVEREAPIEAVPYYSHVLKIDGCEYIVVMPSSRPTQTGIAIIHKANCKNHAPNGKLQ